MTVYNLIDLCEKVKVRRLLELVYHGEFIEASQLSVGLSSSEIFTLILDKAYRDSNNMVYYGFFIHLLLTRPKNEMAEIHCTISILLAHILITVTGAYDLADYHIKEAIKIAPENKDYQDFLVHLQSIPR